MQYRQLFLKNGYLFHYLCECEGRMRLGKMQINLLLRSAFTTFADKF
jgi:hypothetical protein